IARNQLLIAARHIPARWWWQAVVAQSLWGGVALRHGRSLAWLRGIVEGLRDFKKARNNCEVSNAELLHLQESEREIYRIQAAEEFDMYWRLYFLLTGSGAK